MWFDRSQLLNLSNVANLFNLNHRSMRNLCVSCSWRWRWRWWGGRRPRRSPEDDRKSTDDLGASVQWCPPGLSQLWFLVLLQDSRELNLGSLPQIKKCRHANTARLSEDRLTSVQFHPSAQVVLTAGMDQCLSLFQVDGKNNPKIQSVHLDRFPVHKARFSSDGQMVMATSVRNRMFYLYHMIQGRVIGVHTLRGQGSWHLPLER